MKIEVHPFEAYVPEKMSCLILGSFPGKEQTLCKPEESQWFYGAPRNQFWKILELVYGRVLQTKHQKQALFNEAGIGITDIIKSCERVKENNLDENLMIREYNKEVVEDILENFQPKVLFTSRFVEKIFSRLFPHYSNTDILPSPSPRYYRLNIEDKARAYQTKLPALPG